MQRDFSVAGSDWRPASFLMIAIRSAKICYTFAAGCDLIVTRSYLSLFLKMLAA